MAKILPKAQQSEIFKVLSAHENNVKIEKNISSQWIHAVKLQNIYVVEKLFLIPF